MRARSGLFAMALVFSLLCAGGCARNPPPATPAATPPPASAPASDTIKDQAPGAANATYRLKGDDLLQLPPGTEQDLGGLSFDPRGADFTPWIDAFKKEVYRNWVVPEAAQFGTVRGHVDLRFTVERDGSISALRISKSSGTASLDEAARNALTAGKLMALPTDYKPPRVTMQVTFFYNEPPK